MKAFLRALPKPVWTFIIVAAACWIAGAVYIQTHPLNVSEAKVMVRYIVEESPIDGDRRPGFPERGKQVIRGEVDLLQSTELAERVVAKVGPDCLVSSGGNSAAVSAFTSALTVENEEGSNVIRMTFRHPDAYTAQEILDVLVKEYFVRHMEIYRIAGRGNLKQKLLQAVALLGSAGLFADTADSTAEIARADRLVNVDIPNVALIESATPAVPDPSHRRRLLTWTLAGGTVIGLLAALLHRARARSRRSPLPKEAAA